VLKPASELSPNQALNGMHPLPESVRSIDGVTQLYYAKAKGKVVGRAGNAHSSWGNHVLDKDAIAGDFGDGALCEGI